MAIAILALTACSDPGGTDEVTVAASTTQVADLARNVAGDRSRVVSLLDANSDPHEYEPRPSDAEALYESDLILRSGGEVDGWLDQLVDSSGSDAPELDLLDHVHQIGGDDVDPHWWQDPGNASAAVAEIRDALIAVDPGGRETYERNAARYSERIRDLDREIAACMRRVPADDRLLVTGHDALGYFADRYGIEVLGTAIPALTTQAQPSAGETAELVDLIREAGVGVVYPEAGVNDDLERAIAAEAGASVGRELWADTLGPEGSSEATYLGALRSNATAILAGYGADCPAAGD